MVTANQVSLMIVVVWCVVNFGIVRVVGMKLRGAGRVLGLPILLHVVCSGGLVGGGGNGREGGSLGVRKQSSERARA